MSGLAMLPVHRNATAREHPYDPNPPDPRPVQVIGFWDSQGSDGSDTDQWLVIEQDGSPSFYDFRAITFDGWLP